MLTDTSVNSGGRYPRNGHGGNSRLVGFAFLLLFFVSGFAALLYQIIWQRLLTLFGGADVYSVTIIVSAFMGGLGFGSLAGGHLADRLSARARLIAFAACELAVAIFAFFSTSIYYDLLYLRLGALAVPRAALAGLIFIVTLWPTFFMGMSLPLVAAGLTHDRREPGRWVRLLYGWNTLGAACGSLVAPLVLFGMFDFSMAVRLGAILSFGCALGAVIASIYVPPGAVDSTKSFRPAKRGDRESRVTAAPMHFSLAAWIAIYALSGFVALSLEILWFRILGVVMKSNSFTFGHLLGVYLAGLGLGALLASALEKRARKPWVAFLLLQAAIPAVAAITVVLLMQAVDRLDWAAPLWEYLGEYEPLAGNLLRARPRMFFVLYVALPIWLIGIPSMMMGLSFAYLQLAVQTDLSALGRRVGWLQTANIAGGMAGAILTGLVLLDWLGSSGTLRFLVGCGALFLLVYCWIATTRVERWLGSVALLFVLALAFTIPSASTFWSRLHRSLPSEIVQAEDGSGLSVLKTDPAAVETMVFANGLGQSQLPYGGIHTALGACPAMIHPKPLSIAVIGLGSGDTVFAVGGRQETQWIDSIEIIRPELDTLRLLDQQREYPGLRSLLNDPRVHHRFTDGRAMLRRGGRRYDIIEADALRPTSAYAGNLYSVEYFELLRAHLNPGGIAVTWAPTPRVVDSFVKAFAHVLVLPPLAFGSDSPIEFDPRVIRARSQHPFSRDYYRRAHLVIDEVLNQCLEQDPQVYGPDFDRTQLVDVNRDLHPKDEFAAPYTGRQSAN